MVPDDIFKDVPEAIIPKLTYFNLGISEPGSKHDPLRFIQELCRPEDYVILKVDIDAISLEENLVKTLLNDNALMELVDEFFFEHHVTGGAMTTNGWHKPPMLGLDIVDSYSWFMKLRQAGIRAHSWV